MLREFMTRNLTSSSIAEAGGFRRTSFEEAMNGAYAENWRQAAAEELNAALKEEVYMYQPRGLEEPGKADHVCRLRRSRLLRLSQRKLHDSCLRR
mmetsp:Transcript_1337/g.3976  ORF Transcript_1337/g.3976 Transcript_1337/m.3976 type:complete len:95 (-) Transcript_1337:161-445(-)